MRRFVRRSQWRTTSTGTGTCRSGTTVWSPPERTTCVARPPLDGDIEADVCVVGAGYTGLWTAHSLLVADPGLRVVLLEAEIAGFGASGRNGGWCSALFPASVAALAHRHGREAALAIRRAMNATVAEVGRAVAAEGIDAHWRQGGTVVLARTPVQLARARAAVASDAAFGGVDGLVLLDGAEARRRVGADGVLGATYTPHCARVHPARLVRGLARAVERRGGVILERTRVLAVRPRASGNGDRNGAGPARRAGHRGVDGGSARPPPLGRARLLAHGRDRAPAGPLLGPCGPGLGRDVRRPPAPGDLRSAHCRRPARLRWPRRPLSLRLADRASVRPRRAGVRRPAATLTDLFPELRGAAFTHAWGGPLGIPRDWHAGVGLDPRTGLAWAGGYVGDGVGTSNLAGRTLADLVLDRDTELTRLPWVGHRSRRWEPEPLRWLGINAGLRGMTAADGEERLTGRPSAAARVLAPLLGH